MNEEELHGGIDDGGYNAEDLEQLISMAEKVSESLQNMKLQETNVRQKATWVFVATYASMGGLISAYYLYATDVSSTVKLLLLLGLFLILAPISLFFLSMRNNLLMLKEDAVIEKSVLRDLLEMTHEIESASRSHPNFNHVVGAVHRIRLKRLYFATR
jgi:hypothetical protein